MIVCKNICKSYQSGASRTEVLRDVSMSVAGGEFVFLAGPSGSGKSTLLSILGCVLSPDAGTLEIMGQDVRTMSAAELTAFRRVAIGFVFQRFHLFRGLTAFENVRVPLDFRGVARPEAQREAEELLAAVGLADKGSCPIDRLSMGQRQRVAVARALAGKPSMIFADEPTASLDAESGRVTVELLKNLARERGATVVVVTHDSRIFEFADRTLYLEDGRLAIAGTSSAFAGALPTNHIASTALGQEP